MYITLQWLIKLVWNKVKESSNHTKIELSHIPQSILDELLEASGVDLSTSVVRSDGTLIKYNIDFIHFYLDFQSDDLRITKEEPDEK